MNTRRCLLLPIVALALLPLDADASQPELPDVVLYAPRGQEQQAGVLALTCLQEGSGGIYDAFQIGWPPVRVRASAPLLIRFETAKQPSEVEIRGPRGLLPFTLEAYAPEGSVSAWDARFSAPGRPPQRAVQERNGRRFYTVDPRAWWTDDEDCPKGKRGEWAISMQSRKARR